MLWVVEITGMHHCATQSTHFLTGHLLVIILLAGIGISIFVPSRHISAWWGESALNTPNLPNLVPQQCGLFTSHCKLCDHTADQASAHGCWEGGSHGLSLGQGKVGIQNLKNSFCKYVKWSHHKSGTMWSSKLTLPGVLEIMSHHFPHNVENYQPGGPRLTPPGSVGFTQITSAYIRKSTRHHYCLLLWIVMCVLKKRGERRFRCCAHFPFQWRLGVLPVVPPPAASLAPCGAGPGLSRTLGVLCLRRLSFPVRTFLPI
jgi:hypothetical protein